MEKITSREMRRLIDSWVQQYQVASPQEYLATYAHYWLEQYNNDPERVLTMLRAQVEALAQGDTWMHAAARNQFLAEVEQIEQDVK